MPIRPEEKSRYPADWAAISRRIRFERAGNRCECAGECGDHENRCNAVNHTLIVRNSENRAEWALAESVHDAWVDQYGTGGKPEPGDWLHVWQGKPVKVVLTVAHLDHTPENCAHSNLRAMCQRCHLVYDRAHHAETRRRTRDQRSGQEGLF